MTYWHSTSYSDFHTYQTFHQFPDLDIELDFQWITRGFHGAFTVCATGVACQQGTLTLPDTWFRPFLVIAYVPTIETSFLELAVSFLDFRHWISYGTFPILLLNDTKWRILRSMPNRFQTMNCWKLALTYYKKIFKCISKKSVVGCSGCCFEYTKLWKTVQAFNHLYLCEKRFGKFLTLKIKHL